MAWRIVADAEVEDRARAAVFRRRRWSWARPSQGRRASNDIRRNQQSATAPDKRVSLACKSVLVSISATCVNNFGVCSECRSKQSPAQSMVIMLFCS